MFELWNRCEIDGYLCLISICFVSQSKNMHIGDSKLTVGMSVSVHGCSSLRRPSEQDWWSGHDISCLELYDNLDSLQLTNKPKQDKLLCYSKKTHTKEENTTGLHLIIKVRDIFSSFLPICHAFWLTDKADLQRSF